MKDVANERMEICKACLLYKETQNGPICDSKKYMSPDGTEWSFFKKDGWKPGCNCNLKWKTRQITNHCNHGKW